jgi:serine/threonine protein kinase
VSTSLREGEIFASDFRVVRRLAEGGMGAVYVVEQLSTGKQRALKLMRSQLVEDPKLRQRFEQEARVGARIQSEHVVEVIGAGIDAQSGVPWLAMELLEGEDLAQHLARRGPLPPSELLEIFVQLCHALGAAHDVGVVHRDLKPENVFLAKAHRAGAQFTVKVLDFGIAKVVAEAQTTSTAAMGTPLWMAPEQTEAQGHILPAADVWALGLIAYRLLTGRYYWRAAATETASVASLMREVLFESLDPPSSRKVQQACSGELPRGFDAWFARCVNRDPSLRHSNAREALRALEPVLRGEGSANPGISAPIPPPPSSDAFKATVPVSSGQVPASLTTNAPLDLRAIAPPQHAIPRRSRIPAIAFGVLAVAGGAIALAWVLFARPPRPPIAHRPAAGPSARGATNAGDEHEDPTLVLAPLSPTKLLASSTLVRPGESHGAEEAFDGKKNTAWCSATGKGDGEWIDAQLGGPHHLRRINLTTGYDHRINDGKTDLFALNSHARRVRLFFDGKEHVSREVGEEQRHLIFGKLDVTASTVRLVFEHVWPGKDKGEQVLCISEVVLLGEESGSAPPKPNH